MHMLVLVLFIITFESLAIGQKPYSIPHVNDATQLEEIENKWAQAIVKNDVGYVDSVTAPEWSVTDEDAAISDKTPRLAALRAGTTKFESMSYTDLRARVYGSSAVITGVFTEEGTRGGQHFQATGRFTDTFVKRNGKWLAVATHMSNKPAR